MEKNELAVLETLAANTAEALGIPFFPAEDLSLLWKDSRDKGVVIGFRDNKNVVAFLGAAKAMGAPTVYCDARVFQYEDMLTVIEAYEDGEERQRRKKAAEALKRFDGQMEHLILAFRSCDIWHTFQATSPWLSQRFEIEGDPDDHIDEDDDDLEEIKHLSEEELESFAGKLAEHPTFKKLKNKGDQKALAERLFAKEGQLVQDSLPDIVGRARILFQS